MKKFSGIKGIMLATTILIFTLCSSAMAAMPDDAFFIGDYAYKSGYLFAPGGAAAINTQLQTYQNYCDAHDLTARTWVRNTGQSINTPKNLFGTQLMTSEEIAALTEIKSYDEDGLITDYTYTAGTGHDTTIKVTSIPTTDTTSSMTVTAQTAPLTYRAASKTGYTTNAVGAVSITFNSDIVKSSGDIYVKNSATTAAKQLIDAEDLTRIQNKVGSTTSSPTISTEFISTYAALKDLVKIANPDGNSTAPQKLKFVVKDNNQKSATIVVELR